MPISIGIIFLNDGISSGANISVQGYEDIRSEVKGGTRKGTLLSQFRTTLLSLPI